MTVINLNKKRKAKVKAGAKAQADANTVKFGRTKGEKAVGAAQSKQAARALDGNRRVVPPEE
jgi:hypothetical protein